MSLSRQSAIGFRVQAIVDSEVAEMRDEYSKQHIAEYAQARFDELWEIELAKPRTVALPVGTECRRVLAW